MDSAEGMVYRTGPDLSTSSNFMNFELFEEPELLEPPGFRDLAQLSGLEFRQLLEDYCSANKWAMPHDSMHSSGDSFTAVSTPLQGSGSFPSLDGMGQPVTAEAGQWRHHQGAIAYDPRDRLQGRMEDCQRAAGDDDQFPYKVITARKRSGPPLLCYVHEKTFTNKGNFDRHQDRYGCGPGTGKELKCRSCQEIFKRTDKFWGHLEREPCRSRVPPNDPAIMMVRGRPRKLKVSRRWSQDSH